MAKLEVVVNANTTGNAWESKQNKLIAGENIKISANNKISTNKHWVKIADFSPYITPEGKNSIQSVKVVKVNPLTRYRIEVCNSVGKKDGQTKITGSRYIEVVTASDTSDAINVNGIIWNSFDTQYPILPYNLSVSGNIFIITMSTPHDTYIDWPTLFGIRVFEEQDVVPT